MISNIRRSNVGTVEFDAQFAGMRQPQNFLVYPIKKDDDLSHGIIVQSGTRIGRIFLDTGNVFMSKPHPRGAYFHHLPEARPVAKLSSEELLLLKTHIAGSADGKGTSGVSCENEGAINVLKS